MGNILGENHLPYVQEQIKVRQKILGKNEKSSQDIVWENGKTSWIRLASSVNIDGQEVPRFDKEANNDYTEFYFGGALFREQFLELSSENYSGNRLASELTLSGGTPLNDQHRFGIASTNSPLPGIQNSQGDGSAAYGLGGTEFGIKPMPGITGFSSKTYDNGSLRMAEVTIIAHNKKQFEYLESLYLRVGYTMLLEWGNTSYPKKIENGLTTYSSTSDIASLSLKNDFLEGSDKGVDYFYSKIEKNRKLSCGNYDGFLGKVTNFSWGFDTNGSYNITLKLITIGSVIESLKINTNLEDSKIVDFNNPDTFRPSTLDNYLDIVDFYFIPTTDRLDIENRLELEPPLTIPVVIELTPEEINILNNSKESDINEEILVIRLKIAKNEKIKATNERVAQQIKNQVSDETKQARLKEEKAEKKVELALLKLTTFRETNPEEDFEVIEESTSPQPSKPKTVANDATYKGLFNEDEQKAMGGYGSDNVNIGCRVAFGLDQKLTKSYVRLGEFLNFINTKLLIYSDNGDALISIDINEDLYCYSNGYQFPSDPSKAIIRFEASLNKTDQKNKINLLPNLPIFHDNVNGVKVGRIMNLYFSTDYIREQIQINQEEGDLKLLPFLKKLIESLNPLLGGINKLRLRIKDKITETEGESNITQVLEIYDEVQPFGKEKLLVNQTENPILNVYGFSQNLSEGNFVTDYNFSTTIDKDFATQVAIGAQASGRSSGEDSTIFSKWNEGLVDRILPKKLDINQVKKEGTNARIEFKGVTREYLNLLKLLQSTSIQEVLPDILNRQFKGQNRPLYDQVLTLDNIYLQPPTTNTPSNTTPLFPSSFGNLQRSFFAKALSWLALTKNTPTPFIGFLPVNLSLTFDGLSGIKIFDKLRVNSDFLPSNYTDTLEFIITQLDHKFESNKWFTTVGTLSIPKLFADDNPSIVFNIGELIEENFKREYETTDTDSYFYTNQSIITGGDPGKVTINQILKALNQSPYIQAKFLSFLTGLLKLIEKGYEIRINSSFRDFRDSNRVYLRDEPQADLRLGKALRSPHTYGLALDIELYEPTPGNPGASTNLIAGKPKKFFDIWHDLGITDLSNDIGLRWGGVFKNSDGSAYYDCVHFDAAPTNWYTESRDIEKLIIKGLFPNLYSVMLYGYKTNFRDFGLGDSIYNVSLKDLLLFTNGGYVPGTPELRFTNNMDRRKSIGSLAREDIYKSILIDGNLTYFNGSEVVNLFDLLTNSTG